MKIEQLRYFLEAARQEHIGKAAEIVNISPSAISHSISALERELGRDLFVKKGKRIFLTSHGKLLMERAGRFINELEAIKDEFAADTVELQGYYRLAGTHLLCARYLAPAWSAVQKGHPGLTAEMFSLRSSQVLAGVASGEYDLGLCFNPQPHAAIESQELFEDNIVLVVRRGHPALAARAGADKDRAFLKELGRYPAALPKSFVGIDNCETHPVFARFGLRPRTEFMFDTYEVAASRLLASDSWGFFPAFIARLFPGLVLVEPKGWKAPARVAAVRPRHRQTTRVTRLLAAELERRLKA